MPNKNPLIYLDNCCYNRPYNNQTQEKIKLETEAKLYVQELIKQQKIKLVWSFILDFENNANPLIEQKESIIEWKGIATVCVSAHAEIEKRAIAIQRQTSLKAKDALHIACALQSKAEYLLTTDKKMLKSEVEGIKIINPVDYVFILAEED